MLCLCYLFHAMIVYYTKANEVAGNQSLKDDELENYLYFVVLLAFLDNLCTHICFYSLILILKHLYFFLFIYTTRYHSLVDLELSIYKIRYLSQSCGGDSLGVLLFQHFSLEKTNNIKWSEMKSIIVWHDRQKGETIQRSFQYAENIDLQEDNQIHTTLH